MAIIGGTSLRVVIDHDSPVPLHAQLARVLRDRSPQAYPSRVPSILSLAQEYGVSHRTATLPYRRLRPRG